MTSRLWPTGWRLDGPLVLGNYVYADGAANVRVASAVDALTARLQAERRDLALAFLATPTDVFAVPADAVAQSARAYAARSAVAKLGAGRCGRCPAGGCSVPPTRPGPTRASARAWCPSKGPTTPWPSACSGGAPRSPATAAQRCR